MPSKNEPEKLLEKGTIVINHSYLPPKLREIIGGSVNYLPLKRQAFGVS